MSLQLWFDVGIKRYTTEQQAYRANDKLWFDVGIKRYTTNRLRKRDECGCGLMQESKDIQPTYDNNSSATGVV